MKSIRCLYCGKDTTIHKINAQKRIKGKVVTIKNAPVYYCAPCNETFLSKETQDVFRYIQERNLEDRSVLYDYDDMARRIY